MSSWYDFQYVNVTFYKKLFKKIHSTELDNYHTSLKYKLRWSFLTEIFNLLMPLAIFAEELHRGALAGCLIGF